MTTIVDTDAERSVVACMLLDPAAAARATTTIPAEAIHTPQLRDVFAAVVELGTDGVRADPVSVAAKLREGGRLKSVGGALAVAQLVDEMPTATNFDHYARIVTDCYQRRRIVETSRRALADAANMAKPIGETVEAAATDIFAVSAGSEQRTHTAKSLMQSAFRYLEQSAGAPGIESGYPGLDRALGGLRPGAMVVIAGTPGMGKTSLAMCIAQNVSIRAKVPSLTFSLEMSEEQLSVRAIASESGVDSQRIEARALREYDYARITPAMSGIASSPMHFDFSAGLSISQLRAKAREMKATQKLGLVVVDYLQLMSGSPNARSREQEVSEISRGLKAMAKELSLPVLALSQLNRKVAERSDRRPKLSDLRESGAIEQDADAVLFVHRDDPRSRDAMVIVEKNRNGPTCDVDLVWCAPFTRFDNPAQERAPR